MPPRITEKVLKLVRPPKIVRGSDSLLGRYLLGAGGLVLLIVGTAWYSQHQVDSAVDITTINQSSRESLGENLHLISTSLWSLQSSLQSYLLEPDGKVRDRIRENLSSAISKTDLLAREQRVSQSQAAKPAARLARDLRTLSSELDDLLMLRADPIRLFPSVRFLVNDLEPGNREILGELQLSIAEARENLDDPDQREILKLLSDLRYNWSQRVSHFRLLISSRVGIFLVSPEAAITTSATNMASSQDAIDVALSGLDAFERAGKLDLQAAQSLPKVRAQIGNWNRTFRRVFANYGSDSWRLDNPILKERIEPLMTALFNSVRELQNFLKSHSEQDMATTAHVADLVSNSIWYLALIAALLALGGQVMVELSIRRPLQRVASALKAEARGETQVELPALTTRETRDLGVAFEQMREQVRVRQERLRAILDNTAEGIITIDENGVVEDCNPAAVRLFGWNEREAIGHSLSQLINVESDSLSAPQFLRHYAELPDREHEVTGRHRDGTTFPLSLKVTEMNLQGRLTFVAMVSNISERKAIMERLRHLAEHDGLTGLYNRTYFHSELERLVGRIHRKEQDDCALLYIDLDHFKFVNDTLGHAAGDRLLIEISSILDRRTRKGDLVARLGGDEFVVLLYDVRPEQIESIADSFRRHLSDYDFRHDGQSVTIGCSIGVTVIEPRIRTAADVLSRADLACHLAKRAGRNQVHLFVNADAKSVAEMSLDIGWSRRIREAIQENRFVLAAQPIVSTRDRRVSTYEILLRMRDEHDNIVMPSGFMPSAEHFGLSHEIDQWVVTHAIPALAACRQSITDCSYTINLSAQSLNTPALCDLIREQIRKTGVDPHALVFEITENTAIGDMEAAVRFLEQLRALGCRTALDDFGSGMSSFAYLQQFPVDIVKIDGRFVRKLDSSQVDLAMCRAMNDIAHALGKVTVAECIENEAAFNKLRELGVDYVQGFYLGRPVLIDPSMPANLESARRA